MSEGIITAQLLPKAGYLKSSAADFTTHRFAYMNAARLFLVSVGKCRTTVGPAFWHNTPVLPAAFGFLRFARPKFQSINDAENTPNGTE
ncbi:hypothetical protein HB779_22870 (plasmid) [Phyllobacterium sp. 628]|uniref:hypothetical protein n=1 Tax=Phyllobacterium sp. 628 TaxID=2718938 RepID=UPI0016624A23|nr:hypothetical protein [Phyllobacterium sp. 628]QND54754.1 hypothetical protein HB779_22870 [Phyllobacterium sp. 628]